MNRKLALAVASACMVAPAPLYALGLGTITLHSNLDQKLNADIRLYSDNPSELDGALVSLASPAAFARAGIDRPLILSSLRFKVVRVDGHPAIRVTSDQPVREPFLNFIVEVDWRSGRILRQYTVLLNPPTMTALRAAGVRPAGARAAARTPAAAAPVRAATASARQSTVPAAPARRSVRRGAGTSAPGAVPGTIRTERNDTLWGIAQRVRPNERVTIEQMMLALLDANPQAFYDHNINRLKAGYVLRVPDISQVLGIDPKGALAQVRHQNLLWEQYRRRLAQAGTGTPAAAKTSAAKTSATPSAAQMEEERLRLLAPGSGASGAAGAPGAGAGAKSTQALKNQLALANEAAASKAEEAKDLQGRVTALQGQVDKLKELLSLKDQQLADLQSRLKAQSGAKPAAVAEGAAQPAAKAAPAPVKPAPAAGEAAKSPEAAKTGAAAKPEAPAAKSETPAAKPATPPAKPPAPPVVHRAAPPPRTPSGGSLRDLLNDRGVLGMLGGLVLALGALVWLVLRRRRSAEEPGFPRPLEPVGDEGAGDAAGGETAAATESAPTADAASAEEAAPLVAEAGGDALAEAEIYLAYGRYEQAAEQLAQAVRAQPDRPDLKAKLLEAYHGLGDRERFEATAEALYADLGDAAHPLWAEVARWGAELCPEHPLFRAEPADAAAGAHEAGAEATGEAPQESSQASPEAPEPVDALLRELVAELPADEGAQSHPSAQAPAEEPAAERDAVGDEGTVTAPAAESPPEETREETPAGAAGAGEADLGFEIPGAGAPAAESAGEESAGAEPAVEEPAADADRSNVIEWEGGLASGLAARGGDSDAGAQEESADEESALGEPDEVGTKLDLARAYLDMGDQEGARELLAEVLEEGSDGQREEAEGLMQQLSA